MGEKAVWTLLNINYIVTVREDFRVGVVVPDVGGLLRFVRGNTNTNSNNNNVNNNNVNNNNNLIKNTTTSTE